MTVSAPQTEIHILITDDDPNMRAALQDIVEAMGKFKALLAGSGDEALEIAQNQQVHLALLDYQMPRLTGLETLQLLRQLQELLPAILLTADATMDLVRQAMNARFFSVIPKPFNKNVVKTTVVQALIRFYGNEVVEKPQSKQVKPPEDTAA